VGRKPPDFPPPRLLSELPDFFRGDFFCATFYKIASGRASCVLRSLLDEFLFRRLRRAVGLHNARAENLKTIGNNLNAQLRLCPEGTKATLGPASIPQGEAH